MATGNEAGSTPDLLDQKPDNRVIRPLTVRQILEATQSHSKARFRVDGREIGNVTAVVEVVYMDSSDERRNVYEFEDGSKGRVVGQQWEADIPGTDDDPQGTNDITEHTYVRVVGTLSQFNGTNKLNVKHIRPVVDPHEIFFHIFEVIYTTLHYEHGSPSSQYLRNEYPLKTANDLIPTLPASLSSPGARPSSSASAIVAGDPPSRSPSPHPTPVSERPSFNDPSESLVAPMEGDDDIDQTSDSDRSSVSDEIYCSADEGTTTALRYPDSRVAGSMEDTQSDIVPEGSLSPLFDKSTARLATLSLWDDNEPAGSTPLPSLRSVREDESDQLQRWTQNSSLTRDPLSNLTILQRNIMLLIFNTSDDEDEDEIGVSESTILSSVRWRNTRTSKQEVLNALRFLIDEGYVYSTIDESHFKVN